MCYHAKIGRSASKGVHINRKEPTKLESAWTQPSAVEVNLTPENTPLPTCAILPNLVVLGQTVRALLRRFDPLSSRLSIGDLYIYTSLFTIEMVAQFI